MSRKEQIISTTIIVLLCVLILLGVLSLIIKTFIMGAILHTYLRLLSVLVVIKVLHKCFKEQLTKNMNKALVLCGCTLFLDLVVIDAVRFVLNNGISTILFLPMCLPICFMIIMFYAYKDTWKDKNSERSLTYIVGIPLLILSFYFEVLSFIQI